MTGIVIQFIISNKGCWHKVLAMERLHSVEWISKVNSTACPLCGGIYFRIVDIYSFIYLCYGCRSFWQQLKELWANISQITRIILYMKIIFALRINWTRPPTRISLNSCERVLLLSRKEATLSGKNSVRQTGIYI